MDRYPDFHLVRYEHIGIHDALLNWARVVRDNAGSAKCAPCFRHYRSSEVWISEPARIPTDSQAGWGMERSVGGLPVKHRDAIRWHYVYTRRPPAKAAHKLAVTQAMLFQLVHDGRSMLKNRCKLCAISLVT